MRCVFWIQNALTGLTIWKKAGKFLVCVRFLVGIDGLWVVFETECADDAYDQLRVEAACDTPV